MLKQIYKSTRTISMTMLVVIGLLPIFCLRVMANDNNSAQKLTTVSAYPPTSAFKISQAVDSPLQQRLEQQREAERVLKDGERLRQNIRNNNGFSDRELENRVGDQINKVRESGTDPQKVREADTELNRLRERNNRDRYYNPFYSPYYSSPTPLFAPSFSDRYSPENQNETSGIDNGIGQKANFQILGSTGFKDGQISPGLGIRYNNIGLEIAGIFNEDSLPGSLNNFSLPSNFLFNDLGVKKVSPQVGGDFLGFVDVSPTVSIYGSLGLYFQNLAQIAQSQATNELYKQTDVTNVAGAVGAGVNYNPSDNVSLGLGYHSLRGVTARFGIKF
jgi:opacity protein-like surface antigen